MIIAHFVQELAYVRTAIMNRRLKIELYFGLGLAYLYMGTTVLCYVNSIAYKFLWVAGFVPVLIVSGIIMIMNSMVAAEWIK